MPHMRGWQGRRREVPSSKMLVRPASIMEAMPQGELPEQTDGRLLYALLPVQHADVLLTGAFHLDGVLLDG